MPTYISLINYTDQGIRNIKDSPKRLDAAKKMRYAPDIMVGVQAVREFYGVFAADRVAVKGLFITTSGFTPQAATSVGILHLITDNYLENLVGRARIELATPRFSVLTFKSHKVTEMLDLKTGVGRVSVRWNEQK